MRGSLGMEKLMARTMTALIVAAFAAVSVSTLGLGPAPAAAQSSEDAKPGKPLRGTIHYRRKRGGYSYKSSQTMSGAEMRRFYDPDATRQTPGGPFDNGFFFDSGIGPHGGQAPYQH